MAEASVKVNRLPVTMSDLRGFKEAIVSYGMHSLCEAIVKLMGQFLIELSLMTG